MLYPSATIRLLLPRKEYLRFNYQKGFGTIGKLIETVNANQLEDLHSFLWDHAGLETDNTPSDLLLFRPNTSPSQMLTALTSYLESYDLKDLRTYDTASLLLFTHKLEIFSSFESTIGYPMGYEYNKAAGWFNVDTNITEAKFQDYRRGSRKGTDRIIPAIDPFIHLSETNGVSSSDIVLNILPKIHLDALYVLA